MIRILLGLIFVFAAGAALADRAATPRERAAIEKALAAEGCKAGEDIESAAAVLGLDMATVQDQLALARGEGSDARRGVAMGEQGDDSSPQTITMRGREIELPPGVSREQVEAIQAKARDEGRESLTEDERALLGQVMRSAFGGEGGPGARGGNGPRPGRRGQPQATQSPRPQSAFDFTGDYIVFTMRNGVPTATPVRTGLTDLD